MKKIIRHENGEVKVITINNKPSKTQQQYKESVDINNIIKKYKVTGELSHLNRKQGVYLDSANLPSYQEALNMVISANDQFAQLPSQIRKQFNNNPQEMISFLDNPQNDEEAIRLGLKVPAQQDAKTTTTKKQTTKTETPTSSPSTTQSE